MGGKILGESHSFPLRPSASIPPILVSQTFPPLSLTTLLACHDTNMVCAVEAKERWALEPGVTDATFFIISLPPPPLLLPSKKPFFFPLPPSPLFPTQKSSPLPLSRGRRRRRARPLHHVPLKRRRRAGQDSAFPAFPTIHSSSNEGARKEKKRWRRAT